MHAADGIAHEVEPLPTQSTARFALEAPELVPGAYRVEWRALSQDTHVVDGEFAFTITAGALD